MLVSEEMRKNAWSKIVDLLVQIADKRPVMKFLVKKAEEKLWRAIVEEERESIRPAQGLKYAFVRNLLETTAGHLARGIMSKDVFHKMVKVFARNVFVEGISQRV